MKLNIRAFLWIFFASFQNILGQNEYIVCSYGFINSEYACTLLIYNPNGLNNFLQINGTHVAGMTDGHVSLIVQANGALSKNIPSIICSKFANVQNIELRGIQIQKVDDYSFRNCTNMAYLNLYSNKINEIHEKTFERNEKLSVLYLYSNQLEELPQNLFSPLKDLKTLWIDRNKLKVISSSSFSIHPKLTRFDAEYNQINAIDEKFIDNVAVTRLDMSGNVCANTVITDNSASRDSMRAALRVCFENYQKLTTVPPPTATPTTATTTPSTTTTTTPSTTTTTTPTTTSATTSSTTTTSPITTTTQSTTTSTGGTLPPGCSGGFLIERVCSLEDETKAIHEDVEELRDEVRDKINELKGVDENILKKLETLQKTVDYLENKVLEWTTNPCSCP